MTSNLFLDGQAPQLWNCWVQGLDDFKAPLFVFRSHIIIFAFPMTLLRVLNMVVLWCCDFRCCRDNSWWFQFGLGPQFLSPLLSITGVWIRGLLWLCLQEKPLGLVSHWPGCLCAVAVDDTGCSDPLFQSSGVRWWLSPFPFLRWRKPSECCCRTSFTCFKLPRTESLVGFQRD